MRKKLIALFASMCMIISILPVTAMAAGEDAPYKLYVGNTIITQTLYPNNAAYWTSNDGGTTWNSQTDEPTSDSYVHYDGNCTLTLHNAKIQGKYDSSIGNFGEGIYATSLPEAAVSLHIVLEGKNTVYGEDGIYVSAGKDALLSISGSGSLIAEGTGGGSCSGISVQSRNGKAELIINNVDVTATNNYEQGIQLQSADSSLATLIVNGGKLIASGKDAGIQYVFGVSSEGNGTPSLTVVNNAVVRANGGIIDDSSSEIKIGADNSGGSNGGIVFNGKNGTVYGDVILQEHLEIGDGESLTLNSGANLDAGSYNVIVDGGTLDESLANNLVDKVKYAPTIIKDPISANITEGQTATFTVEATGSDLITYQWQQSTNGSEWTDIQGATNNTYTTEQTTESMNNYQYRCIVKNSIKEVTSDVATLTVTALPTYNIKVETGGNGKATASQNSAAEGTEITLTATPNSGYHFVRWEVTQGNVTIKDNKFTMPAEPVTVEAIFERNSSGGGTVTPPSPTHTEIIGKDRYETAALIADDIGYYDTAVLVNAENTMSDGLSASALSGKYNAPILLTKKDSIPDSTVKRLKKASTIYIIGGENAISENVEKELSGKKVIRIGGSNRYETSELIAEHIGNYDRAFIVNGLEGEADAMSASAVSSKYNAPIILTNGKNSDYDQKSDTKYYAIGGENVLSDSIVSEYNAERISGDDRYETNREVIEKFYSSSSKYYFTNGNTLVDALSASLPAKNYGIVLVSSKSDNSVLEDKNTVQVGGMDFEISAK